MKAPIDRCALGQAPGEDNALDSSRLGKSVTASTGPPRLRHTGGRSRWLHRILPFNKTSSASGEKQLELDEPAPTGVSLAAAAAVAPSWDVPSRPSHLEAPVRGTGTARSTTPSISSVGSAVSTPSPHHSCQPTNWKDRAPAGTTSLPSSGPIISAAQPFVSPVRDTCPGSSPASTSPRGHPQPDCIISPARTTDQLLGNSPSGLLSTVDDGWPLDSRRQTPNGQALSTACTGISALTAQGLVNTCSPLGQMEEGGMSYMDLMRGTKAPANGGAGGGVDFDLGAMQQLYGGGNYGPHGHMGVATPTRMGQGPPASSLAAAVVVDAAAVVTITPFRTTTQAVEPVPGSRAATLRMDPPSPSPASALHAPSSPACIQGLPPPPAYTPTSLPAAYSATEATISPISEAPLLFGTSPDRPRAPSPGPAPPYPPPSPQLSSDRGSYGSMGYSKRRSSASNNSTSIATSDSKPRGSSSARKLFGGCPAPGTSNGMELGEYECQGLQDWLMPYDAPYTRSRGSASNRLSYSGGGQRRASHDGWSVHDQPPVLEHVPEEDATLVSASATATVHRAALLAARHSTDGAVGDPGRAADVRPGLLPFRQMATSAMDGNTVRSYHHSHRSDEVCDAILGSRATATAAAAAAAAAADASVQGRLAPLRTWDERGDADQQQQQLLPSPPLMYTPQVAPPLGPLARTAAGNGVSHWLTASAAVSHGAVSGVSGSQRSRSMSLMEHNSSACGATTCAGSPTLACVPCTPVALTAAAAPLAAAAQGEGSQCGGGDRVAAEEGAGPSSGPRTPLLTQQGSNGAASPSWGGFGALGAPLGAASQPQGHVRPGSGVGTVPAVAGTPGVIAFGKAVHSAFGGGPLPSLDQGHAVASPPTPLLTQPGSAAGSMSGAAEPAAPTSVQHPLQHQLLQRRVWSRLSRTNSDCESMARTTATSLSLGGGGGGGGRALLRQEDSMLSSTGAAAALQAAPWAGGLTHLQLQVSDPREVTFVAQIGAGCSGRVYRAVWRGQAVAVKAICHEEVMARGGLCEEQVQAIEREAALGICLDHPNVVAIYAAYTTVATVATVSRRALTIETRQQPALSAPAGPAQQQQQQQNAAAAAEAAGSAGVTAAAAAAAVGRAVSVGGCAPRVETFILMELCTHGSLRDALDNKRLHDRRGAPKLCQVLPLAWEVACAVDYLHANDVVHGDLKAANVMLCKSAQAAEAAAAAGSTAAGSPWAQSPGRRPQGPQAAALAMQQPSYTAKVADFSSSTLANAQLRRLQGAAAGENSGGAAAFAQASPTHAAPELFAQGSQLTLQSDIYALGVVLWELWTGRQPYANHAMGQLLAAKRAPTESVLRLDGGARGGREHVSMPDALADICRRCWGAPEARPAAREVVTTLTLLCRMQLPHVKLCMAVPEKQEPEQAWRESSSPRAVPPALQVLQQHQQQQEQSWPEPAAPSFRVSQVNVSPFQRPSAAPTEVDAAAQAHNTGIDVAASSQPPSPSPPPPTASPPPPPPPAGSIALPPLDDAHSPDPLAPPSPQPSPSRPLSGAHRRPSQPSLSPPPSPSAAAASASPNAPPPTSAEVTGTPLHRGSSASASIGTCSVSGLSRLSSWRSALSRRLTTRFMSTSTTLHSSNTNGPTDFLDTSMDSGQPRSSFPTVVNTHPATAAAAAAAGAALAPTHSRQQMLQAPDSFRRVSAAVQLGPLAEEEDSGQGHPNARSHHSQQQQQQRQGSTGRLISSASGSQGQALEAQEGRAGSVADWRMSSSGSGVGAVLSPVGPAAGQLARSRLGRIGSGGVLPEAAAPSPTAADVHRDTAGGTAADADGTCRGGFSGCIPGLLALGSPPPAGVALREISGAPVPWAERLLSGAWLGRLSARSTSLQGPSALANVDAAPLSPPPAPSAVPLSWVSEAPRRLKAGAASRSVDSGLDQQQQRSSAHVLSPEAHTLQRLSGKYARFATPVGGPSGSSTLNGEVQGMSPPPLALAASRSLHESFQRRSCASGLGSVGVASPLRLGSTGAGELQQQRGPTRQRSVLFTADEVHEALLSIPRFTNEGMEAAW